ncbi:unnamed protein product [Nezara viridula]|uniref:Uncharacterized protein n=1 Tax=Nezara viridula TaxID=85310 RepID=A0A9P0MMJ8_NEZVI|nr:unnamed protein product [Nezara viridula]
MDLQLLSDILAINVNIKNLPVHLRDRMRGSAKVREILSRGKTDSWEARMTLSDSMVSSTLLYGAEIWSLNYLRAELEKNSVTICSLNQGIDQSSFLQSHHHYDESQPLVIASNLLIPSSSRH